MKKWLIIAFSLLVTIFICYKANVEYKIRKVEFQIENNLNIENCEIYIENHAAHVQVNEKIDSETRYAIREYILNIKIPGVWDVVKIHSSVTDFK